MKFYKLTAIALVGAGLAACTSIDDIQPESGTLLAQQVKETTSILPERADATYSGMYTRLGSPYSVLGSGRPDDFGFIMIPFSSDLEAADILIADSGYNWFSVCGELSSRNANYANPYIRYAAPYNTIADANSVITSYPADTDNPDIIAKVAQAKAMRAYAYLSLAPYFQFAYDIASDKPCVPLVTEETTDFTNNPRATVAEVYEQILSDLNYAIEKLEGYVRPDKAKIDQQVAYGLRARAYLNMARYAEAAADAEKAAEGYTPASIEEVSVPSFKDVNEHNWIWGYDMTTETAKSGLYATSSSWIRSFSGESYSAATQTYSRINILLYNKIPDADVRKGWWVDENLESPLLEGLAWPGFDDVANADDGGNSKLPYLAYTNVKFGCNTIGTTVNDEDWPFMRVEEMILIQAEGYAKSGNEAKAKQILNNFVSTYRFPGYNCDNTGRSLSDEIWFQRRLELWGEGFANNDTRRLHKPLVRFHEGEDSNFPANFRFNMTADDGWWLLRFPQSETNTNLAIIDNTDGTAPVIDQNGTLRDGVTD